MPLLTETEVIKTATSATVTLRKTAGRILTEARATDSDEFDVFLSHSSDEPENILLGVKLLLEGAGLSVYVDKYSDPQLSPDNVTPETAEILRDRMQQSRSLLFVHSQHSTKSRWMPWELGYFDGSNGRVGVIPVTRAQEKTFRGEEYLNLYPYVDVNTMQGDTSAKRWLWINQNAKTYARFDRWIRGRDSIRLRT